MLAKIMNHYRNAKEKHPYFCETLYPKVYTRDMAKLRCQDELAICRELIRKMLAKRELQLDLLLNCEVWEAHQAIANGDTESAVEECYDAIAVLLRIIDVLDGRQELGRPKEGEK